MLQQGNHQVDPSGNNGTRMNNYEPVNNNIHQVNPPQIMNNQVINPIKLSPYVPVPFNCSTCNTTVNTKVTTKCSCANICCCVWFGPLIWVCFQCCRKKQISCNDIYHTCPKCNGTLMLHESC